ncbi:MAG: hypothetical protein ACREJC_07875, partial [Tepidisphaeraceae bacterium]
MNWRENGYRLFEVAPGWPDPSMGWFGCLFESNCFAMSKALFTEVGGLNEQFQSRGGGLVNLDFLRETVRWTRNDYILLPGEATFHQFHGGVASNAPIESHPWDEFHEEYKRIRGKNYNR